MIQKRNTSWLTSRRLVVFVNCGDLFMCGSSDGEEIEGDGDWTADETNELFRLTKYVAENEKWGSDKFCCWKRNMQPQRSVVKRMKEDGAWDEFMESLALNPDSIETRRKHQGSTEAPHIDREYITAIKRQIITLNNTIIVITHE